MRVSCVQGSVVRRYVCVIDHTIVVSNHLTEMHKPHTVSSAGTSWEESPSFPLDTPSPLNPSLPHSKPQGSIFSGALLLSNLLAHRVGSQVFMSMHIVGLIANISYSFLLSIPIWIIMVWFCCWGFFEYFWGGLFFVEVFWGSFWTGQTSMLLSDYFLISYCNNLYEGGKLKGNKISKLCSM